VEITDDRVLEGTPEVVGGVLTGMEASLDKGWEGEGVNAGVLTGVLSGVKDSRLGWHSKLSQ